MNEWMYALMSMYGWMYACITYVCMDVREYVHKFYCFFHLWSIVSSAITYGKKKFWSGSRLTLLKISRFPSAKIPSQNFQQNITFFPPISYWQLMLTLWFHPTLRNFCIGNSSLTERTKQYRFETRIHKIIITTDKYNHALSFSENSWIVGKMQGSGSIKWNTCIIILQITQRHHSNSQLTMFCLRQCTDICLQRQGD